MIGNDIVDWAQARRESNWQRRGFLNKLFTLDEQRLIHEADHPEQMVWTLWSVKESVYKANLRQTGQRRFAPQKIHCQLQPTQNGSIEGTATYDYTYRIRATLTPNYVSSIAILSSIPFTVQESVTIFQQTDYNHQHTHLQQFITLCCATTLAFPAASLTIQKDDKDVPFLVVNPATTASRYFPLSLSHHGRYGAFVIERPTFLCPEFREGEAVAFIS